MSANEIRTLLNALNDIITESDSVCWDGYEKVPGKKDYEKGSCRKKTANESNWCSAEEDEIIAKIEEIERRLGMGVMDPEEESDLQSELRDLYTQADEMADEYYDDLEEVTLEEHQDFHEEYGYLAYCEEGLFEAEYQGRKVKLNKPMRGDVKKFKVYVKNPKGNVVKVNFGQKGVKIKKDNPERRKSFRARHNCDNPGPKHKARYWSCRKW